MEKEIINDIGYCVRVEGGKFDGHAAPAKAKAYVSDEVDCLSYEELKAKVVETPSDGVFIVSVVYAGEDDKDYAHYKSQKPSELK